MVLDVLVQRRRDKSAAKRLLRKLLKKQMRPPRVMITDKLASYGAAKREVMPSIEHRPAQGPDQAFVVELPQQLTDCRIELGQAEEATVPQAAEQPSLDNESSLKQNRTVRESSLTTGSTDVMRNSVSPVGSGR
jgi:hypothetical protein